MNADGDALASGFIAGDSFDVDDIFEAVDGGDFALAAFVRASDDEDFVIFSNWYAPNLFRWSPCQRNLCRKVINNELAAIAHIMLVAQLLGQRRAHNMPTNT